MRILRRINAKKTVVTIVILLLGSLATAYWMYRAKADLTPSQNIWRSVSWRLQLYLSKAEGDIPDLSWSELWDMTRTGGHFGLDDLITRNMGLEGGLRNPFVTSQDREAGAYIFGTRCAACHGSNGAGGLGPSLIKTGFKHGDSDLAMYKVLRDGVPGTAMVSPGLSFVERWQVIGYLKTLQPQIASAAAAFHLNIHVSSEELQNPDRRPDEWLTYSRALNGWRYSPLSEITVTNVTRLRLRWVYQSSSNERDPRFEASPLVADGTIFTTEPPAAVVALDARSGQLIWKYERSLPPNLPFCCGPVNRGLAILGDALFLARGDGYLVAINANDGRVIWETEVASPTDGATMTVAPLIVNHSVVVGISGAQAEIRGFLAAYDVATGKQQWKFYTIPGPGERGHETWENEAWRTGGGPAFVTGAYDPSLDLLYWGVGNPAPAFLGAARPGDNLFTDSVIALRGNSGELAWYFQFTPHDEHDWDSAETPILAEGVIKGTYRKVICWPNKNGFYYVLDRETGEFLVGVPFVEQNWAKGLSPTGRPILSDEGTLTVAGRLTRPSFAGGTSWEPAAFDPRKGLLFIPATEGASVYTRVSDDKRPSRTRLGIGSNSGAESMPGPPATFVRALDFATGEKRWEYRSPQPQTTAYSGLLATAGGLVLGASGRTLFALDSATGEELWRFSLGGDTWSAPISFTLEGHQVIAIAAGRAFFVFELPTD